MSDKSRCACGAIGPPYNHFIDCSMLGMNYARVVVKGDYSKTKTLTAKLDLQKVVDDAVGESLAEGIKVVRQDEAHLFSADILVVMPIDNPWRVYDSSGVKVGAAMVAFDGRGLMLHITLDKQTPEAFDMEVNPLKVQANVNCYVTSTGALTGTITLKGL
jgi:hypothetical protein